MLQAIHPTNAICTSRNSAQVQSGRSGGRIDAAALDRHEPASDGPWLAAGLSADGTALRLRFKTPPVERTSVRALLAAWHEVVQAFASDSTAPLAGVGLLSPSERQRQHALLADGPWSHVGSLSVTDCFAATVQSHRDRVALAWGGGRMSYGELDEASRHIAMALVAAGVKVGDIVAVALPRSAQGIAAILGILRAGAGYLPVDLTYPVDRLRFMFGDAGVRMLLARGSEVDATPLGVALLDVEQLPPAANVPLPQTDGQCLAYVMYTSGSTGQPKGVEILHRSIVRLVRGARFMRLDDGVVMLHAAPLGFDASTLEVWGPLLNGGCCVLHDEAVPTGPGLATTIAAHGVSAAWLTAALFNAVVDDDPRHLRGLQELLIGGEALSLDHVRRFLTAVPDTALINGYGPTETTTFATTHRISLAALEGARSVPIGRPITLVNSNGS